MSLLELRGAKKHIQSHVLTRREPLAISWQQRVMGLEPGVALNLLDLAKQALLQSNYGSASQALCRLERSLQHTAA